MAGPTVCWTEAISSSLSLKLPSPPLKESKPLSPPPSTSPTGNIENVSVAPPTPASAGTIKDLSLKRPLNPFMMFTREFRSKYQKENPGMPILDISRKIADVWNKLTAEEKRPYFEAARNARLEHKKVLEERGPLPTPGKMPKSASSTALNTTLGRLIADDEPAISDRPPIKMSASASPYTIPLKNNANFIFRTSATPSSLTRVPIDVAAQQQQMRQTRLQSALDSYYLALCQPAFPISGERPLAPASANYYYEQVQVLSRGAL